jgi:hypothetical protein
MQYDSTGTYFERVKIWGKIFRDSLGTDVFTAEKLRLLDFIKQRRKLATRTINGKTWLASPIRFNISKC